MECLICDLEGEKASLVWDAWDPQWRSNQAWHRLSGTLADLGVHMSEERVREHFRAHRPVQPQPLKMTKANAEFGLTRFPDDFLKCLEMVFRMGRMTTEQIHEAFYPEMSSGELRMMLTRAAQAHYLYGVWVNPEEHSHRSGLEEMIGKDGRVWYPGKGSHMVLQTRLDLDHMGFVSSLDQVSFTIMAHDLKVVRAGLELQRAWGTSAMFEGEEIIVSQDLANWYGPSSAGVALGYSDPWEFRRRIIRPDAFIGLGVHRSSRGPGALGFFFEYDHGSKERPKVVDQMFSYNALAHTNAVGARFPQMKVKVPVLMMFSSRARMESITGLFREQHMANPFKAPVFVCAEEEWLERPGEIIESVWHENASRDLIGALMDAWAPDWGSIPPGERFKIDPKASPIVEPEKAWKPSKTGKSEDAGVQTGDVTDYEEELWDESITDSRDLAEQIIATEQYLASLRALKEQTDRESEPVMIPPVYTGEQQGLPPAQTEQPPEPAVPFQPASPPAPPPVEVPPVPEPVPFNPAEGTPPVIPETSAAPAPTEVTPGATENPAPEPAAPGPAVGSVTPRPSDAPPESAPPAQEKVPAPFNPAPASPKPDKSVEELGDFPDISSQPAPPEATPVPQPAPAPPQPAAPSPAPPEATPVPQPAPAPPQPAAPSPAPPDPHSAPPPPDPEDIEEMISREARARRG